jgi:histone-lysine N-methyltransferase SETMAR
MTINCKMLTDRLKPTIQSKHKRLLSKGVVLFHDSTHPHTAAHIVETLRKLKFGVMAHPPYSPDLTPSDCHLFGPLRESLKGHRLIHLRPRNEGSSAWVAHYSAENFLFWGHNEACATMDQMC